MARPTDKKAEDLQILVRRAQDGDHKAMARIRSLATQNPDDWAELFEAAGDLAWATQETLVREATGTNLLNREAIVRRLDSMHEELAGPSPSPLETLLVERITTCWLHLQFAEASYTENMKHLDDRQHAFHMKRMESAQRRYLQAIKTLAQVRRLLGPAVQVNVAKQQVNIAGR